MSKPTYHQAALDTGLSREELAGSLLFFRRTLTRDIIIAMIKRAPNPVSECYENPAAVAEDLANAICERLAARETGSPEGYKASPPASVAVATAEPSSLPCGCDPGYKVRGAVVGYIAPDCPVHNAPTDHREQLT